MGDSKLIWNAQLQNGRYRNPVLYMDFSDPDVIRVEDDYFMVASSFCNTPGIPLLHSRDLVSWQVINYVLDQLPGDRYDMPVHGGGVWAPSIRWHDGTYYVVFPMPDQGIYCCTAQDPWKKWSAPHLIHGEKGWIDPCPFWDDDGSAYLVSAFAKSRCGINSFIHLAPMRPDCSGLLNEGKIIFDGHHTQPTIEGPKMYKYNGYYYILAPAGGVTHGWQTALRSKHIWGPYEEKIVMLRKDSEVNGPHQGGLVETPKGECWFLHFQDAGPCGRIVHLQPVCWKNDWPVIGLDLDDSGCGQPVDRWDKPDTGREYPALYPDADDDFRSPALGKQWQWNANSCKEWYDIREGRLYLYPQQCKGNICDAPNLLLQKFMAPGFTATVKANLGNLADGEKAGFIVLGRSYRAMVFEKTGTDFSVLTYRGEIHSTEACVQETSLNMDGILYLRLKVTSDMMCTFSYSINGKEFIIAGDAFPAAAGVWVGSKFGLFALGEKRGEMQVEWVKVLGAGVETDLKG